MSERELTIDESRASRDENVDAQAEVSDASEERNQVALRVAEKLRDAGYEIAVTRPVSNATSVRRSDRVVISLSLISLTAAAWAYLLWLSANVDMGGMDMSGFRVIRSGMGYMMPAHAPWWATGFAFVFTMWTVMMVGITTPSAAPMIFMYARVGRQTERKGTPFAATAWFVAGYFIAWAVFSLLATLVQWALERSGMLDSAMASTNGVLGAILFIAAGTYQWTRLKHLCLVECQMPFAFVIRHGGFRHDALGSLVLGLRHGGYCVGCCWALMALLFVGGVMNPLWIVLLALFILLEKITSNFGRVVPSIAGAILIVAGTWMLILSRGLS
jgi:predicted metal-binding membrane protein